MRKGLGKGRGAGYFNILPKHDSMVHSMSAKGRKQEQRVSALPEKQSTTVTLHGQTYNRADLVADGEVYNVKEEYEESGMPTDNVPENWYEYKVSLLNKKTGALVAEMDSLRETYDGLHKLSMKLARESMNTVLNDVNKKGKVEYWF